MKERINVWFKANRETKGVVIQIDNTLESLQNLVGGYIETVKAFSDATLIVNEEGRLRGLPYNFTFCGADLVGPVVLAGVDGDEFTDVPKAGIILMQGHVMDGQITIDEWLGLNKDPADELIEIYIKGKGYTLDNMEQKIEYDFRSYCGGCWAEVCFDFCAGKAMFSKRLFNAFLNRKKPEPGVYVLTKKEYTNRVRRILTA